MLEQTTLEVIAVNDHRKCYRCDHTTVIVIMPFFVCLEENSGNMSVKFALIFPLFAFSGNIRVE